MPGETITSLQNPRIKAAMRLRERRERDAERRFLIDGARELVRALASGVRVSEAFVCESLCRSNDSLQAIRLLAAAGSHRIDVTANVLAKVAFGDRNDGLVAVGQLPDWRLATLNLPERPLIAVVEGVEKPGNLGAILRTADAAGVSAVIVADGTTDLFNPNCIRASMGTVFTVPVCMAGASETLEFLRSRGTRIFAARVDTGINYTTADLKCPAAIVLGSEAQGLSAFWSGNDITPIRLPMLGIADSLNVSVTAAVLFYEALRQGSA